jgi:hypothetical protein
MVATQADRGPLRVTAAARPTSDGRLTVAVVLRRPESGACRVLVRTVRPNQAPAAHRALLAALWAARRVGARRVAVEIDDGEVVAQVTGRTETPPSAMVAVLQSRALLNAFDAATLRYIPPEENDAAFAAAAAPRSRVPIYCDLPLWAAS